MFIKALYVGECHRLIDKTLAQLEQIHTQIKNIQKSIEGIIALEGAFKGKTAKLHLSFLSRGTHAISVVSGGFYYQLHGYFTGSKTIHTAKLEPVEQDLHTMKNYVSQIRELGNSGQINIATY
ncbi:T7SS effector LXG polymorphic toxin [Virgibacillus proomii]|uniref:T7SS effector LXG polymorphic toxin n=1 Tax=Virgibacillus proomii TaxID=84407 RepID=UPI001C0FDA52|nr:T7SS effector LXG polymorphic toxin [Virgibacillus proomii]MBU5267100.1 LXG domain-containing protein [Virgibacillus proomii]